MITGSGMRVNTLREKEVRLPPLAVVNTHRLSDGLRNFSAEMDAAYKDFMAELAEHSENSQQAMWAEIYDELESDDESPPKALRTPSAVINAARKQFTNLVSSIGSSVS